MCAYRYVHSSRDTFALSKLMSSLNDPLLEELKLHLYKGLVSKAKFFKVRSLRRRYRLTDISHQYLLRTTRLRVPTQCVYPTVFERDLILALLTSFVQHCDPEFTKHVVMRLQDKIYSPGDYIIRAGQEGDCMFFIIKVRMSPLFPAT